MGLGWWADSPAGLTPVLTLLGLALGVAVGILGTWLRLRPLLRDVLPVRTTGPTMADDSDGVTGVDGSRAGTERTAPMNDAGSTAASTVPEARVQALAEVARRQRTMVIVAAGLAVVAFLVGGSLGYWPAGLFIAIGIGLALVNTVVTEMSMIRMTATGDDLSRKQFAMSALRTPGGHLA